jgi:hypothetical protein
MRFGKNKMFLFLNGIIATFLLLYFGSWLMSGDTEANIVPPYNANTINIQYRVNENIYTGNHLRNDIPFSEKQITIKYFVLNPASSRISSFLGMYAEPLAWWFVFLLASAMLLLMPNTVFSRGTMFQLQKKFPWISMDEYFPAPGNWYRREKEKYYSSRKPNRLSQNNEH